MSSTRDPNELLKDAFEAGDLSSAAWQALTINADMASGIQAGLGISPDDVPASEVVLVSMMPDDSGSISCAGNADHVREGHNLVLDALLAARQRSSILVHNRFLNGHVLYPYVALQDATRMTSANYDPQLGTPLFDQTAILLGTVLAKTREFEENGVPARSVTLIISDGGDCGSQHQNARSVRAIVEDMLRREIHIVAALGIDDGHTDFKKVFGSMGIPPQWILTTRNSDREIRKAFQLFSQSAIGASQSAKMQSSLGGFGA
jgi:hypothetical protein